MAALRADTVLAKNQGGGGGEWGGGEGEGGKGEGGWRNLGEAGSTFEVMFKNKNKSTLVKTHSCGFFQGNQRVVEANFTMAILTTDL